MTSADTSGAGTSWASDDGRTKNLVLSAASAGCASRQELWTRIVHDAGAATFLELGVWRGLFAEHMLRNCPTIARYFMLDPWRRLDQWNKPFNVEASAFDEVHASAMARTDFAGERRVVLRGTTTEVIDAIPDASLDIAYIDGDHTLRGIAIDLIRAYPKVRPGGLLGGDDYSPTIWQHAESFEPTLVCPFAAYFAESQGATIIVLPHGQFVILKPTTAEGGFSLIDTTGRHGDLALLPQITRRS